MIELFENIKSGAEFSECRKYRYALWRIWDESKPLVMFVGLNPSTANEDENDNTIKSVTRISKFNGYGGFYMMNCFPLISTNPDFLKPFYLSAQPYTQNQFFINNQKIKEISLICQDIVFAWGNFKVVSELNRDKDLIRLFPASKALHVNKNGSPKHPLYCKSDTKFIPFKPHHHV